MDSAAAEILMNETHISSVSTRTSTGPIETRRFVKWSPDMTWTAVWAEHGSVSSFPYCRITRMWLRTHDDVPRSLEETINTRSVTGISIFGRRMTSTGWLLNWQIRHRISPGQHIRQNRWNRIRREMLDLDNEGIDIRGEGRGRWLHDSENHPRLWIQGRLTTSDYVWHRRPRQTRSSQRSIWSIFLIGHRLSCPICSRTRCTDKRH